LLLLLLHRLRQLPLQRLLLFRLWLPQLRQLLRLFGRLLLLGRSVVPKPRVQSRLLGQATPLPVPKRVICVEMGRGSHFALM
jgi:hypothetical protein